MVETQNFGAETGQAGSAVISAITKTGGNEFHGSAFIEFQPKSFISSRISTEDRVPKPDYNRKQFGGDLGGPIIPGKLHFYVAAEGTNQLPPDHYRQSSTDVFPQNLVAQTNVSKPRISSSGSISASSRAIVTDEDTVNLIGYLRREDNLGDYRRTMRRAAMAAGSGPTRIAISCSGGTMPAIS